MKARIYSNSGIALFVLLASACASTPGGQPASGAQSSVASAGETATTTIATKPEEEQLVCKTYEVTGTRLQRQRICKTPREWEASARDAQEFLRDIERRGSTQPDGQTLETGG